MAKGVIYVMSSIVPGLIKIGKTATDRFDERMRYLEGNGYSNICGLRREYAIEVDDFDKKESLLHNVFARARVGKAELFALDVSEVVELMSSMEGSQVYPKNEDKSVVFKESSEQRSVLKCVPDGKYFLKHQVGGFGVAEGELQKVNGKIIVLAGAKCAPITHTEHCPKTVLTANVCYNVLQEDFECKTLSNASFLIIGKSSNGWSEWKDSSGKPLKAYRDECESQDED